MRKTGKLPFRAIVHEGGEATRVVDRNGTVLMDLPDDGTGTRPEVLRGALRQMLIGSLPDDTVRWGMKLIAVDALGDGAHRLTFADGSTADTTLVVGADGAWSKVRALVSDAQPEYTGLSYVETYLYDVDNKHADTAVLAGAGSMFALSPGRSISTHREANGIMHAYASLRKPENWFYEVDFADADSFALVTAEYDGWASEITALLTDTDTTPVLRPIYALPADHRWARVPGVTLVGDAAHLMPPVGDGANLAMFDGAQLAKAIVAQTGDVEAALADFENAMFERSSAVAVDAQQMQDMLLGENTPHSLVEFFAGHGG